MRYLLLIYENELRYGANPTETDFTDLAGYAAFNERTKAAGQHLAGEALQPTSSATSVRVRDGQRIVTDGPFAETKEQLGGFYMIEAKDLDEAIELAAQIPAANNGTIEVRPIYELDLDRMLAAQK